MKFRLIRYTIGLMLFFFTEDSIAHTLAETNQLVQTLLESVIDFSSRDCLGVSTENRDAREYRLSPFTWSGFLDQDGTPGWVNSEKKAAFGYYLSTLATNDCMAMTIKERYHVWIALRQCRALKFAEAWPSMKALALNPRGIHRELAIETAITLGPIDDAMTEFVEMIGTNVVAYGYEERGTYCFYQQRLAAIPATNVTACAVRDRAVRRFYNHRIGPSAAGAVSRDFLFRDYIDGYAQSSNRLEFANYVLTNAECQSHVRRYFTSIINQLLSSGHRYGR